MCPCAWARPKTRGGGNSEPRPLAKQISFRPALPRREPSGGPGRRRARYVLLQVPGAGEGEAGAGDHRFALSICYGSLIREGPLPEAALLPQVGDWGLITEAIEGWCFDGQYLATTGWPPKLNR